MLFLHVFVCVSGYCIKWNVLSVPVLKSLFSVNSLARIAIVNFKLQLLFFCGRCSEHITLDIRLRDETKPTLVLNMNV